MSLLDFVSWDEFERLTAGAELQWQDDGSVIVLRLPTAPAALTLTPASAPYPGAEVHRWSVVVKHEDPNGVDASEVDRELAAAMQRELNGDEWEYTSGRAGARWRKHYDHSAEAWRWHAEVRRV